MRVLFSISVPLLLNKYIKSECRIPLQPYHVKVEPAYLLRVGGGLSSRGPRVCLLPET